jgi:hypothetical protein
MTNKQQTQTIRFTRYNCEQRMSNKRNEEKLDQIASLKRTIKLGNWQEEKALENMMDGKVYDPKIKTSTALTNLRVIKHSANVDAKDYRSVVHGTYSVPQEHVEYKNAIIGKTKGPRDRLREQMMKDTVDSEFRMKEAEAERERNSREMETTSQAAYTREFKQTMRDKRSGLLTGERRDPYYLVPSPITYYLHTLISDQDISFPVTTIGSLNKPWARGDSVSAGDSLTHSSYPPLPHSSSPPLPHSSSPPLPPSSSPPLPHSSSPPLPPSSLPPLPPLLDLVILIFSLFRYQQWNFTTIWHL